MALQLTKEKARVFRGRVGKTVRLGISVAKNSEGEPASIISVTYNGATVKKAPFEFTTAAGDHGLVVVYVSTPNTRVSIDELDTADPSNTQPLALSFFDPSDPAEVILIRA